MTDTLIIFIEIIIAAIAAITAVIFYVHRSTNRIIYRLEDTKLRTAIEANSQVIEDVRKELVYLAKQLAALNGR